MRLFEPTSVAIITIGVVAIVYTFFWGATEEHKTCQGLCLLCSDVHIDCEPVASDEVDAGTIDCEKDYGISRPWGKYCPEEGM